jgi:hypothetical protein
MIGLPLVHMFGQTLPESLQGAIHDCIEVYREDYDRVEVPRSTPFAGVAQTLAACQAAGRAAPPLEADFMLDGVDEVLAMFTPRQLRLERMQQPEQAVSFRVPGAGSWIVGPEPAAASITAPLPDMYLGLWGRSNLEGAASIEGDAALALRVLRGPLTP